MATETVTAGTELASEAFDIAAVLRSIDSHIERFRVGGITPTEDDLASFTRSIRVAYHLADALGEKLMDGEVSHG